MMHHRRAGIYVCLMKGFAAGEYISVCAECRGCLVLTCISGLPFVLRFSLPWYRQAKLRFDASSICKQSLSDKHFCRCLLPPFRAYEMLCYSAGAQPSRFPASLLICPDDFTEREFPARFSLFSPQKNGRKGDRNDEPECAGIHQGCTDSVARSFSSYFFFLFLFSTLPTPVA